ncbi:hypothetical protein [Streptomyces sp. NPDC058086]|uniref:hypothetical protein n=1 Tax=Streptomyces sp. NPDC058086 TaxID=3346334 RepID=UPI0036EB1E55
MSYTAEHPSWWRRWATHHRVAAAVLAGSVATHLATVFGFWLGGLGMMRLDWNTSQGWVFIPFGTPLEKFLVGGLSHYVDGIVFAVIFACALHPALPWHSTVRGNLAKGLLFGTLLACVSISFMTPFVFAPARGLHPGFLSLGFGRKYVAGVFLWHWVYGLHLGLIYSPLGRHGSPGEAAPVESDRGAVAA